MNPLKIGNVIGIDSSQVDIALSVSGSVQLTHNDRCYSVGQLGSYVAIEGRDRTLVALVTGCGVDHRPVAGATGGLSASARAGKLPAAPTVEHACPDGVEPNLVMHVQLLGELHGNCFARGVNAYPLIGDEVRVATHDDFKMIFGGVEELEDGCDHPSTFRLGQFALNTEFDVRIAGSDFFAKHAAIVGNSGSGKSCATAKILQEVLDLPQSQVVLFDMHGEYRAAFSDEDGQIDANVTYLGVDDLVLPYWLLRYEEIEALFVDESNPIHVTSQISFLRSALLEFKQDAAADLGLTPSLTIDTPIYFSLERLYDYAQNLNEARYVLNDEHLAFAQLALRSLEPEEQQKLLRERRCRFNRGNPEGETPHPLYHSKLLGLIDKIDTRLNDRRYEFLLRPVDHAKKSRFFRDQLDAGNTAGQMSNVLSHLIKLLTGRVAPRSNLTIIDLSGIPFEIVDITVAVLTRLLFDLNFWTPADRRHPILLAYEEAHNYIPRVETRRCFAKKAVERVAKEGRKYGVSAMVISQRPSELSETVLAQCNNMLALRLSNPEDQTYIAKVVSDQFANLINMLPVLKPGEGFVIGDAVLMPMRTLIDLPARNPQSGNVDFFRLWSLNVPNNDTDEIIDHWWRQNRQVEDGEASAGPEKPPVQQEHPQTPFTRLFPSPLVRR